MSERRKFREQEKHMVYERYGGRCALCGTPISRAKMTISHKIPLSRGGNNGYDNLRLTCWTCNHMVANLTFEEFVDKVNQIWEYNNIPSIR